MPSSGLDALLGLDSYAADSFYFLSGNAASRTDAALRIAQSAPQETPVTLSHDSFLFTSDHADVHPGLVQWNRPDYAAELYSPKPLKADSRSTVDAGDITVLEPQLSGAKGGVPGPPSGGDGGDGDGGGGGGDGGILTNYFSGSADGDFGYDIWIEFKGSDWTFDLQQAFINAADYFTTVITDDIGGGGLYRGKTIDDVYVSAELKAIDGTGGVLGQAGPTALWSATQLTAAGVMQFDVADVPRYFDLGLWDDIVTHEMMHVLGFGSLWDYGRHAALVDGYEYIGANALAAYRSVVDPNAAFIPVEDFGGSGTAGAHWDEGALDNELMTGFINNDGDPATNNDNYLSEFSVMALADLGYNVSYQDYPYDDMLIG